MSKYEAEPETAVEFPCPNDHFRKAVEEKELIDHLNCSLYELKYLLPAQDIARHRAYLKMFKLVKPHLEARAQQTAAAQEIEDRMANES